MSYQVLARKWRPRSFREMVGQTHVLKALINALDNQRLHHAYLFTGTRGVGKTTIARIIAKCLNCETGITSTPCGTCSVCREIDEGRFVDLIEIDAASRTKVEDTRELLDNVQYAPSRGRFKVYLIDEVHMLSTHSFNALLKTLPGHRWWGHQVAVARRRLCCRGACCTGCRAASAGARTGRASATAGCRACGGS